MCDFRVERFLPESIRCNVVKTFCHKPLSEHPYH